MASQGPSGAPICRDCRGHRGKAHGWRVARAIRRPICRDGAASRRSQGPSGALSAGTKTRLRPSKRVVDVARAIRRPICRDSTEGEKDEQASAGRKGHPAPYLPGPVILGEQGCRPVDVARAIRRPICRDCLGAHFAPFRTMVARAIRRPTSRNNEPWNERCGVTVT